MTRAARTVAAALGVACLVIATLAAGSAWAQGASAPVLLVPVRGEFHEIYMVHGRVVDATGMPVNQATVEISVTNVKGVDVKPFRVGTNCHGDFAGYFPIGSVEGARAKVKATLVRPDPPPEGFVPASGEARVDKAFRRSDIVIQAPFRWGAVPCPEVPDYWPGRITVQGRFINVTGPQDLEEGRRVYADPVKHWPAEILVTVEVDGRAWPPDRVIPTDERGDFKYSYTFEEPVESARITVGAFGRAVEVPWDPVGRIAIANLNFGGEMPRESPGPLAAAGVAALAAAALALVLAGGRRRGP